jgi:hypothetical protein
MAKTSDEVLNTVFDMITGLEADFAWKIGFAFKIIICGKHGLSG